MGFALLLLTIVYGIVAFAVIRFTPRKARPVVAALAVILPFADSILGRYFFLPVACSQSHYKTFGHNTASGLLLQTPVERSRIPIDRVGFLEVKLDTERGIRQYPTAEPIQLNLNRRPVYREGQLIMEGDELIARYQLEVSHSYMFGNWINKMEYKLVDRKDGKLAASGSGFAFYGGQLGNLFTNTPANCLYGTEGLVRFLDSAFP